MCYILFTSYWLTLFDESFFLCLSGDRFHRSDQWQGTLVHGLMVKPSSWWWNWAMSYVDPQHRLVFSSSSNTYLILAVIWTDLSIFRFQVVRLKLENSKRIVGTLIPNTAMTALLTALDEGSEGKEETIYWKTQILQEKIARSRQISLSHELQPMWAQRYV